MVEVEGTVQFRNRMGKTTFLHLGDERTQVRLVEADLPDAYPKVKTLNLGDVIRVTGTHNANEPCGECGHGSRIGPFVEVQTFEVVSRVPVKPRTGPPLDLNSLLR
jgi:aspartyl/asparaginyl-tRNA synthetase